MGRWDAYNDAWDEADIIEQEMDYLRDEAERRWADRYNELWDRLVDLGVLDTILDHNITLPEMEAIAKYLPEQKD